MMDDVSNKGLRAPEINSDIVVPNRIILQNVDLYSGLPLEGGAFELSYDRTSGQPMAMVCDREGRAEFTIEYAGQYTLEQTEAPSGHKLIPNPIVINLATNSFEVVGDQESDWYDYDNSTSTLTVKNTPIQSQPEGGTKMKVATDNSLKELIKLVKSQPSTSSGGILNVTLDYTIPSYSQVEVETKRKRVYADVPCANSKVAMNAQITPNDNIENVSLLTYAEPFDGYIRCYFSEQPTESYIVDSVELTPVTSIIPPKIYGIQRDITDPSPEWTRTGDAVGMTATASVGNTAGRSDFDKCMPWAGMVRETLSTGDVMVKIPKFYYRRYREGNIEHIEIADKPVEGFSVHPSFNHTGLEKDFIYIGAYKTSSNNKSVSGANPQVNQARATMRNHAKSKGAGWGLIDIAALSAIQMLFLVEYATSDSQKAIGRGYCDGNSSALRSGTCNNVPNLTGRPAGTDGKVDVVYRGIEGIWGNVREWVDGVNFSGITPYVCNDPSKYADDTSTGYTKLSFNLASSGYISQEGLDTGTNKHVMLPSATSGSETTHYCDYGYSSSSGWRVLGVSGYWNYGSECGLFFAGCVSDSSGSYPNLGSRLLYIPPSQGTEEHTEITTPVKPSGGGAEEHPDIT